MRFRRLTTECVSQRETTELNVAPSDSEFSRSIREGLAARGLDVEVAKTLAAQIEERASRLSPDQRESLLDGAALASGVQNLADESSFESVDRVREIERMMQAFSGELSKLDESLEVMAAYVRRMRTPGRATRDESSILH